jgi:hypothetical protein
MARLVVGIVIFIIIFVLKVIMGAAAGALKGVEHASNSGDFERYTGQNGFRSSGKNLLLNESGAEQIRRYRELYEEDIITYEEFEHKKNLILNNAVI